MKLYGTLIILWEGGNEEDGYLRYAKTIITDIHLNNWQVHAHFFSNRSLDSVVNYHIIKNLKKWDNNYLEYIKFKKNKKIKIILHMIIVVTYILYYTETY